MKVKELILKLANYDSEAEFCVTLPPSWYKEEADDLSL